MLKNPNAYLSYVIYLRKSRQDDPAETVEEVLAKHEAQLQEYAERELGGRIPEENIYREVVSGESIDERVEIQRVLARIEDPSIEGVLVIEPQRLSRGDLEDCGRLVSSLRYTHTKVSTLMMTYDLEHKMERKFFQDELLRGRDFLEYTKEILLRGRIAAVKRGCYVASTAPMGYDRIRIGKDWTLAPNDDADTIRLIFKLYVEDGYSYGDIARHLNTLGIKKSTGKEWNRDTMRSTLTNTHYKGLVHFNLIKETWVIEHGVRVKKYLRQPEEDVIYAQGKHPAIIDPKVFDAAQVRIASNPRVKQDQDLRNVLAGVLRCAGCGKVLALENRPGNLTNRLRCRTRPACCKSIPYEQAVQAVIVALESAELPKLQAKLTNGEGDAANIQKKRLDTLTKQLAKFREQEENQYELLETGIYTQDKFKQRNAALRAKIEEAEKEIFMTRAALPKNVDYKEKIITLERAIDAMRDESLSCRERNRFLRAIVDKIAYSSKDGGLGVTDVRLEVFLKL